MSITIVSTSLTRPQAIETARRMHTAGWQITEIRAYLTKRGHRASWTQIKTWVDDEYRQRRLEAERVRMREKWRQRNNVTPDQYRVRDEDDPIDWDGLWLALRVEDGHSYEAIAKISRRFFGRDDVSAARVAYRLHQLGVAKNERKAQAARKRRAAA